MSDSTSPGSAPGLKSQGLTFLSNFRRFDKQAWLWIILVALVYIIAARLGLLLALPPEKKATAVWPPSGIAFAAILLLGLRASPGVWLGAFLANFWDYFQPQNLTPISSHVLVSVSIATGSTLQAIVGSILLQRNIGTWYPFARALHAFAFSLIAFFVCLFGASFGASSLLFCGFIPTGAFVFVWWTWWLGDLTGILTVGSAILICAQPIRVTWNFSRVLEALLLLLLLILLFVLIFDLFPVLEKLPMPLAYLTVPLLFWATFRFGAHGAATTLLLTSGLAVLGTANGVGPFVQPTVAGSMLLLQIFTGIISVTVLVMASILTEQQISQTALNTSQLEIAQLLETRTAALETSERRFQAIFHSQFQFIGLMSPIGELLEANRTALAAAGLTEEMVLRKPFWETPWWTHDKEQQNRLRDAVSRAASGEQMRFEASHPSHDGKMIWVDFSLTPSYDENGKVVLLIPEGRDITDRKRHEEELLHQEERFRSAFDHAPIGVALVSPDGRWLRVNRSICDIVGYSEEELLNIDFQSITHPEDLNADLSLVQQILEGKINTYQIEKRYFHKNGHIVHILLAVSLVRDAAGQPLYFISQIKDINQRKEAEERIKTSLKEKEVMLQEIHHRVKNNLQIVSTLLDLQADYTQDAKALEMFKESRGRVKTMALIHEKLYRSADLARIQFADYVRQLADDLYRSYKICDDAITLDIDVSLPSLTVDIAIPCGLILNELISNCFKHAFGSHSTGWIRITMAYEDGLARLKVADNGKGFPPNFDFRDTTSLGLQLVSTLVDQLQGEIRLNTDSVSEWIVTFPLKSAI